MAEELTCSSYTAPELFDSQETNSSDSCLNCTHLVEQLIIAQQELKSAEAIISILKEEGKYSLGSMVPTILMPVDVSNHKPTSNNGRWVKVEHKMTKPKCTTYDNSFQHSTGKLIKQIFASGNT